MSPTPPFNSIVCSDGSEGDEQASANGENPQECFPSFLSFKERLHKKYMCMISSIKDMSSKDKERLKKRMKRLTLTLFVISLVWWRKKIKFYLTQSTRQRLPYRNNMRRHPTQAGKIQKVPNHHHAPEVPFSFLLVAAKKGLVKRAYVSSSLVAYQVLSSVGGTPTDKETDISWKKSKIPQGSPKIASDIIKALTDGGCLDIQALPESLMTRLSPLLIASSPFIYLLCMYYMLKRLHHGFNDINATSTDDIDHHMEQKTFADVAGADSAVDELFEIIHFLKDPKPYLRVGAAKIPRGILLYGPPGCGKTLIARCVATEAKADYFISCSGSDFVEVYVGQGAKRVREVFSKARREAFHRWRRKFRQPSFIDRCLRGSVPDMCAGTERPPVAVLFIDEIDALAKCRDGVVGGLSLGGNDEREQTLNALLTEMDGFNTRHGFDRNPRDVTISDVLVIVIASTNRIQVIDPAILRPGRFDRHVEVTTPDRSGRIDILEIHTRRMTLDDDVSFDILSDQCQDFSGAELSSVANEAGLMAIRRNNQVVCQDDFLYAIMKVKRMKLSRHY